MTGTVSIRRTSRTSSPSGPPKMPYSCWMTATSASLSRAAAAAATVGVATDPYVDRPGPGPVLVLVEGVRDGDDLDDVARAAQGRRQGGGEGGQPALGGRVGAEDAEGRGHVGPSRSHARRIARRARRPCWRPPKRARCAAGPPPKRDPGEVDQERRRPGKCPVQSGQPMAEGNTAHAWPGRRDRVPSCADRRPRDPAACRRPSKWVPCASESSPRSPIVSRRLRTGRGSRSRPR